MTTFCMKLAGIPMQVQAIFGETKVFCKAYLTEEPPAFSLSMEKADIDREREKSRAEDEREGIPVRQFSDAYLETLALYRKIAVALLDYGVVLFHGAVVAMGDTAFLFTAKSGTGKTTHTNLWLKQYPAASIVNGDKPLLKVTESGVMACGTPWQGKEDLGKNAEVPLKAICILEWDTTNHIRKITMKEAFPVLLQQAYRPQSEEAMGKTLERLGQIGQSVEFYRLGCNLEQKAAVVAYEGMK